MTILITLICVLLALCIFAGAFYLAKFVIKVTMRNELLEENYKLAEEHIKKQEEQIAYLTNEAEYLKHDLEKAGMRVDRKSSWKPSDPLSMGERQ